MIKPIPIQSKYLWRGKGPILWGLGRNVNKILGALKNGREEALCELDGRVAQALFYGRAFDCKIRFSGVKQINKGTLKQALRFALRGEFSNNTPYIVDKQFLLIRDAKDIRLISKKVYKRERSLSGLGNRVHPGVSDKKRNYREVHWMISRFILGLESLRPKGKNSSLPEKIKRYVVSQIEDERNSHVFTKYLEKLCRLDKEFMLFKDYYYSRTDSGFSSVINRRKNKSRYLTDETYRIIKIYKRAGQWEELHKFICTVVGEYLERLSSVIDDIN